MQFWNGESWPELLQLSVCGRWRWPKDWTQLADSGRTAGKPELPPDSGETKPVLFVYVCTQRTSDFPCGSIPGGK
ncbi:hypothetical protein JZ751_011156 [Albula glossodonta]|uniref:Uncharacterized protein n=1 Tax=Albula glossodonta TaxID=121402 RepID=A0A8T2NY86_9TELE|nr:hypothetical protein JZ751_011156 [Albula glossodonta]